MTLNPKDEGRVKELLLLAKSVGYQVVKIVSQNRRKPDSRFFIGKGKIEELKETLNNIGNGKERALVIIDRSLKPIQFFNLYKILNTNVIDRVQLILEIFDQHAGSKEAKLQIELAKLKHVKPIIKEWIRQSKIRELPGFLGAGKYKVDAYYLMLKKRITRIERELRRLRDLREKLRITRRNYGFKTVAIIGYTSAGKTSLFNILTRENKEIGEEPFTTLSPKIKAAEINGIKILFLDTVGFIDYVPIEIIEAFYSTLEEIIEASILLLVIDVSEDLSEISRKIRGVFTTLSKIGVVGKPLLVAANKIDLIKDREILIRKIDFIRSKILELYDNLIGIIPTSIIENKGVREIKNTVKKLITQREKVIYAQIPKDAIKLLKVPFIIINEANGMFNCKIIVNDHIVKKTIKYLEGIGAKIQFKK